MTTRRDCCPRSQSLPLRLREANKQQMLNPKAKSHFSEAFASAYHWGPSSSYKVCHLPYCTPIVLTLCFLASNISLLTTIQSSLAEDLNAYDSVSWFASAYLVGCTSTPHRRMTENYTLDCHVEHHTIGGEIVPDIPASNLCPDIKPPLHNRRNHHLGGACSSSLSARPCADGRW